ncbi:MAG: ATP-binding protein [Candidatus Bipolaricaulota bacterium]|nr:ATP-binding protein [Candidatus Bipolaricaulota bacterium]
MPATRIRVFISSVQKEFEELRHDLKAFLLGDAVLSRFISSVFLFEDLPAKDQRPDLVYLEEVKQCDIYIGIFGYEYGRQDQHGISPTEHEYDHATKHLKVRLVYVWGSDEKKRAPKMRQLIDKASDDLIRRRIDDFNALTTEVYSSLVEYLDSIGALRVPPFDTASCDGATLKHISRRRIDWFLETARRERGFPLKLNTTTRALLTHLNLIEDRKPTNAAILLFGTEAQHFHRSAETKCVHCHGTEYRRPFASQQIYSGDLFEQVDQARDFVLAKIDRSVGTRTTSAAARVAYELPPDAIGEAIVNAVAHRDYNSNASAEVRLFADRLEVWNPGSLPAALAIDSLRHDHPSIPNNPLLAESLYLARYIEKAGSGTQMMISLCREAGLPEPDFEQRDGSFVITLWRDWLTDRLMAELGLNDRQRQVVKHAKATGRIDNAQYRDITDVSESTALRELRQLAQLGVLEKVGHTGRAAHYVTAKHKPVINPPNTSMSHENETRHKPAKHVTQTDTSTAKSPKSPDRNVDQ